MGGWSLVRLRTALVLSLALALGAPGVALAQDIDTPAGHHAEDQVVHDAATEARLNRETRLRSAAASQATAAAVAADPGQVGQWGPVVDWPVVGIHVALLPNGKVLAWDSVGDRATETFPVHDFTRATVYDPATGTHTLANVDTGYNVFCAGFVHLIDGSLFLAGGSDSVDIDLRPGGKAFLTWKEHGTAHGRVETVEPPRFFAFRWIRGPGTDLREGDATLVEFSLSAEGDGTRLRVAESGFPELDGSDDDKAKYAEEHRQGWELELDELREYIRQQVRASARR